MLIYIILSFYYVKRRGIYPREIREELQKLIRKIRINPFFKINGGISDKTIFNNLRWLENAGFVNLDGRNTRVPSKKLMKLLGEQSLSNFDKFLEKTLNILILTTSS